MMTSILPKSVPTIIRHPIITPMIRVTISLGSISSGTYPSGMNECNHEDEGKLEDSVGSVVKLTDELKGNCELLMYRVTNKLSEFR